MKLNIIPVKWSDEGVLMLDQRLLPTEEKWLTLRDEVEELIIITNQKPKDAPGPKPQTKGQPEPPSPGKGSKRGGPTPPKSDRPPDVATGSPDGGPSGETPRTPAPPEVNELTIRRGAVERSGEVFFINGQASIDSGGDQSGRREGRRRGN